jgi:hypothetical protein
VVTLDPRRPGIDAHKKDVAACIRHAEGPGKPRRQVRTFGPRTGALVAVAHALPVAMYHLRRGGTT